MNKTSKNVSHIFKHIHTYKHTHMIVFTEVIKVYSVAHGQNDKN